MSASENKALIEKFLANVMQEGDLAAIPSFVATEFVDRTPIPGYPETGYAAVEVYVQMENALLPDRRIEIIHSVADDEFVCVLTRTTGTHSAEMMGIPASGKQLTITFLHMLRVQDGKFIEHWGFGDLMQQLMATTSGTS